MEFEEARKMAEELNNIYRVHTPYPEELADGLVTLDNRIVELEGQRNLLFAATEEMLNLIESSDFDDIDGAQNNDDMNRWHRAVAYAPTKIKTSDKEE